MPRSARPASPAAWVRRAPPTDPTGGGVDRYPFHGAHQAGHRHARAGPAALRGVRRHRDLARRAASCCCRRGQQRPRAMTQGLPVGGDIPLPYDAPPGDTGEATGSAAGAADAHLRLRAVAVPRRGRQGPLRHRRPAARRPAAAPALPGRRPATRSAATATCACRPARTTRRSPCTRSATCPGSPSAAPPCAGPSSASGGRRPRSTSQATPRNLFGFKDGTANLKAEEPTDLDEARVGRRRRRRRRRVAGRRLATSSPGGST